MKKQKEKAMKTFPGGNLQNWELVARMIELNPQEKKRLKIALSERTKERKRQEQKRREQYFK